MHEMNDKEIKEALAQLPVPPHRPDLEQRIITAAMAEGAGQHTAAPKLHSGSGFSAWWQGMRHAHGQKMAAAAMAAAIAIIVFDPVGSAVEHYVIEDSAQVASAPATDGERYTVNGIPLLADISLLEEPELDMEEVVSFTGQG